MLPPFIIDQIRKREEEERWKDDAPRLELPLPLITPSAEPKPTDEERDRGVIIIDLVG
jgi:hypothetical protein